MGIYANLDGVALSYQGGSNCPATNQPRTFTVNILCKAGLQGSYNPVVYGDECNPQVNLVSEYGCTVLDVSAIWEYLAQYAAYFGAFFIVIGVLLTFLGRKLIRPSVCFAGFLTSVFVACFLYYTIFMTNETDLTTYWIFWVVCVGCAVAAAIMAFIMYDHAVIMASVFLGSYAIIIGINCYAGGYINPFTMAEMIKEGLYSEISWVYWGYVAGFVVLVIAGAIVQYRSLKSERLSK